MWQVNTATGEPAFDEAAPRETSPAAPSVEMIA
jgi:hypothetical protein